MAHGSLRLSLSHENRPEEIDYILEVLPGIVSYLRGMSPVWDERGDRPAAASDLKGDNDYGII